jgi:hypothetical protein
MKILLVFLRDKPHWEIEIEGEVITFPVHPGQVFDHEVIELEGKTRNNAKRWLNFISFGEEQELVDFVTKDPKGMILYKEYESNLMFGDYERRYFPEDQSKLFDGADYLTKIFERSR